MRDGWHGLLFRKAFGATVDGQEAAKPEDVQQR